jgi:hypothetical protein
MKERKRKIEKEIRHPLYKEIPLLQYTKECIDHSFTRRQFCKSCMLPFSHFDNIFLTKRVLKGL